MGVLAASPSVARAHSPPPSAARCAALRAARELAPTVVADPQPGSVRVFAMQFKQEARHVVTYATFRAKIECAIREDVLPHLAPGEPNVVAFNEDVGLETIATGSRGAAARAIADDPSRAPSCEGQGAPCATLAALGAVGAAYAPQVAAYSARLPGLNPVSGVFVAATDTLVRGFMQTFSDMARRYGIYVLGSDDQAPFRESTDPDDITLFADPDLPRPASVYVATSASVYNEAFLWGPNDLRADGPAPTRNLVASNRKVPLTPIEQALQITPGPSTGPDAVANLRPYAVPDSDARIGFATSLPAFVYGDPPPGVDPCSDTAQYYMRCLDELGANVVMQDEANPGRWAGNGGGGFWQPLEWMGSTYRAVADPSVRFAYNVTPMLVGNLADLAFDGQTAITQRGLAGTGCHYVGDRVLEPGDGDPASALAAAGDKAQFLALAPWVAPDGPRAALRAVGARLAPGSGDPLQNDYLETAVIADLTFPPDPARGSCGAASGAPASARAHPAPSGAREARMRLTVSPATITAGHRTRVTFTVTVPGRHGRRRVRGATVRFAGRSSRTDRTGRATIPVLLHVRGRRLVTARKAGLRTARTSVPVIASSRARPSTRPRFTA